MFAGHLDAVRAVVEAGTLTTGSDPTLRSASERSTIPSALQKGWLQNSAYAKFGDRQLSDAMKGNPFGAVPMNWGVVRLGLTSVSWPAMQPARGGFAVAYLLAIGFFAYGPRGS
jgi:hypothetical protein